MTSFPVVIDGEAADADDLLAGRYRLLERIGMGGTGRVYRARDELLDRDVAVKCFSADPSDRVSALRRASEARLQATFDHPSLVTLFDAHVDSGENSFLVMELVPGVTLHDRLAQSALTGEEVKALIIGLASALTVVHDAGIVHRDIKPANVLLRPIRHGAVLFQPVLVDFGIAHLVDAARVTSPGVVIGTASYLAPEQVRGEATVPASDIYALGLLTIEALTGTRQFVGDSIPATILARLSRQPEVPAEFGQGWRSLLTAMTSLDPGSRPTAEDVVQRARALTAPTPSPSPAPLRRDRRHVPMISDAGPTLEVEVEELLLPLGRSWLQAEPPSVNRARVGLVIVLVVAAMTILGVIMLACATSASATGTGVHAQAADSHVCVVVDSSPNSTDAARRMCVSVRSAAREASPSSMAA
ncbi:serine/threonine-protein kinase [Microbacterium sp.]|uniref:serine/threonine-protein kinase n=1 Tax=Microbacterium sp. TaxID=51671 RepID=UPI00324219B3